MTGEEIVGKVSLGMTREDVKVVLGEPDDWGPFYGGKNRRKIARAKNEPGILKYGDIELHFHNNSLWLVYSEDVNLNPTTWLAIEGLPKILQED